MRDCEECGKTLPPSSRHKKCGKCRGNNIDSCRCGRSKTMKAKECMTCRSLRASLKAKRKKGRQPTVHPHGTRQRYQGNRLVEPCRCDECKDANNEYARQKRNPELHRKFEPIAEYRSELLQ